MEHKHPAGHKVPIKGLYTLDLHSVNKCQWASYDVCLGQTSHPAQQHQQWPAISSIAKLASRVFAVCLAVAFFCWGPIFVREPTTVPQDSDSRFKPYFSSSSSLALKVVRMSSCQDIFASRSVLAFLSSLFCAKGLKTALNQSSA